MADSDVWYAVMRLIPWSAVNVAGEPLRDPKPEPGEPEHLIPVFSTQEAALAWCKNEDEILPVRAAHRVVPRG